jgi:hypothetical protein
VAGLLGAGLAGAAGVDGEERTLPCLAPARVALLDAVTLLEAEVVLDAVATWFEPKTVSMVMRS